MSEILTIEILKDRDLRFGTCLRKHPLDTNFALNGIYKQPDTKSTGKSTTDLSLEGLFKMFTDDQAAKEWFESNICPDG